MGTVDVAENLPRWADKRFLRALLFTVILIPSVFGASVYISNEVAPNLEFIPLPHDEIWNDIYSMDFYGYNEEYIAVARLDGLHIVDRFFSNVTGPIRVSNDTWHSGAYDLAASTFDELFLTTNGPNGSVVSYGKVWPATDRTMSPFKLFNITGDTTFRYIERSDDAPNNFVYLGSETLGVGVFRRDLRQVSFLNTSNGLPSNSVTALKIRGAYLLVGTGLGFTVVDRSTGSNFSCTEDELDTPFSVRDIDYYPLTHEVFAGTEQGLLVFRENGSGAEAITRLTDFQGLPSAAVSFLQIDKSLKRLYVGCTRGLAYLDLESEDYGVHAFVNRESLRYNGIDLSIQALIVPEQIKRTELYLGTSSGYVVRVPLAFSSSSQSTSAIIVGSMNLASFLVAAGVWVWYIRSKKVAEAEPTLEDLVDRGEGQSLEYKSTLRWDLKESRVNRDLEYAVAKTVAGFLNAEGGRLLIGVDDNGIILGLESDLKTLSKHNHDKFEGRFSEVIDTYVGKPYRRLVATRFAKYEGKDVCIITVKPSKDLVFTKKLDGGSEFPVRLGNRTETLGPKETEEYRKSRAH